MPQKGSFLTQGLKSVDFNGHLTPEYLREFPDIDFGIGNGLFEVFLRHGIVYLRGSPLQMSERNGYITELLSIDVILPISHVSNIYSHNEPLSLLLSSLLLHHLGFFAYNKYYPVVQEEAVIFLTYSSRFFLTTYPTNRRTYRWVSCFFAPFASPCSISRTAVRG